MQQVLLLVVVTDVKFIDKIVGIIIFLSLVFKVMLVRTLMYFDIFV